MMDVNVVVIRVPRFYNDGVSFMIFPHEIRIPTILEKNSVSSRFLNPEIAPRKYRRSLYPKKRAYVDENTMLKKFLKYDNKKWKYLRSWIRKLNPRLVLINKLMPSDFSVVLKTANIIKELNEEILVGLMNLYRIDEAILYLNSSKNIDFVIVGDQELPILEFVKKYSYDKDKFSKIKGIAFRSDKKIIFSGPFFYKNINELPIPDRDLVIDKKLYPPSAFGVIECGRGCIYSCKFCYSSSMPFRLRDPNNIVKEIAYVTKKYGTREIAFFITSILHSRPWAKKLFTLIKGYGLKIVWIAFANANQIDEEILKLMKSSGCYALAIGIETGSVNKTKEFNKVPNLNGNNRLVNFKEISNMLKKHGILLRTGIIFGLPDEDIDDIINDIRTIRDVKPDFFRFHFIIPKLGTELYREYKEKGLLANYNLDFYDTGHLNVKTRLDPKIYMRIWDKMERLSSLSEKVYLRKKFLKPKIFFLKTLEYLHFIKGRFFG